MAHQKVLEVGVKTVEQLFDHRDPAPFRERTLDPNFVDYLREGGGDRIAHGQIHIVVWLATPCSPGEIEQAVHSHFDLTLERTRHRRREQVRAGWIALTIAAIAVVVLTAVGELVASKVAGSLGSGLQEAISISGWVLMWRPIEILIYDGIPWRRERRLLRALRDSRVEVRVGARDAI
ncbi:MAG: hypothetical protein ACAI38_09850 [Myxococcota bacterium]